MKELVARARAVLNLIAILTILMAWIIIKSSEATRLLRPEVLASAYITLFQDLEGLSVSRDQWGMIGIGGQDSPEIWIPSSEDIHRDPVGTLDQTAMALAANSSDEAIESLKARFRGVPTWLSLMWGGFSNPDIPLKVEPLRLPEVSQIDAPTASFTDLILYRNPDLETCLFAVAYGYQHKNLRWRLVAGTALAKAAVIHFRTHGGKPGTTYDSLFLRAQGTVKVPFIEEEVSSPRAIVIMGFGVILPLLYLLSLTSAFRTWVASSQSREGLDFLFFHPSRIGPALATLWLAAPLVVITWGIYRFRNWTLLGPGVIAGAVAGAIIFNFFNLRSKVHTIWTLQPQVKDN